MQQFATKLPLYRSALSFLIIDRVDHGTSNVRWNRRTNAMSIPGTSRIAMINGSGTHLILVEERSMSISHLVSTLFIADISSSTYPASLRLDKYDTYHNA